MIMNRRGFLGHVGGAYTAITLGAAASTIIVADPALAFLNRWESLVEAAMGMPAEEQFDFYASDITPIERAVSRGEVPAAESAQGAAAMLRKALSWDDMEEMDAALVTSALKYLEQAA